MININITFSLLIAILVSIGFILMYKDNKGNKIIFYTGLLFSFLVLIPPFFFFFMEMSFDLALILFLVWYLFTANLSMFCFTKYKTSIILLDKGYEMKEIPGNLRRHLYNIKMKYIKDFPDSNGKALYKNVDFTRFTPDSWL